MKRLGPPETDLVGKPYEVIEYIYPAHWHGFGRRKVHKVIFQWSPYRNDSGEAGKRVLARESLEQGWVWRGFSREARLRQSRTLESGLMPGAVMREVPEAEE